MNDPPASPTLKLLMRANCALCDHVVLALELMRIRHRFDYAKIDIDADPELAGRYGLRIPVLLDGELEICAGQCDPAVIESYLGERSGQ